MTVAASTILLLEDFCYEEEQDGQVTIMARGARGCRINVNSEGRYMGMGVRSRVAVTPRPGGYTRLVESENDMKGGE